MLAGQVVCFTLQLRVYHCTMRDSCAVPPVLIPVLCPLSRFLCRAVIWSARSGLGNAVRGLVATFVYALLSGREVLLSTGGPYGATFETVALGFEYRMDRTERAVPRVPIISLSRKPAIWDTLPVVQTNPLGSHESFWFEDMERRRCVHASTSPHLLSLYQRCEDLGFSPAASRSTPLPCSLCAEGGRGGRGGKGETGRVIDSSSPLSLCRCLMDASGCKGLRT